MPGSPSVFVVYAGQSVVIPPGNVGGVETFVTISVPAGFSGRLSNIPGCNITCTSSVSKDFIYRENKNLYVVVYNHSFRNRRIVVGDAVATITIESDSRTCFGGRGVAPFRRGMGASRWRNSKN